MRWIDLSVRVTAPVRWRNTNDPRLHVPDRKRQRDSRLRLLNDEAGSFNTVLPHDIAVSSAIWRKTVVEQRGRGS